MPTAKKIKTGVLSTILILILLFLDTFGVSAFAKDETVSPLYNNTNITYTNFVISNSGLATISVGYTGYNGVTSGAVIKSYVQKKTFGLLWKRIDNGQPNKEWIDTATGSIYSKSHTLQLTSKGTYRLVVEYTIKGSGGSPDTPSSTIVREYS